IDLLNLRAPLVAVAIVWLLWKGSAADKRLVFLFAMLMLAFLSVIRGRPVFYGILVAPGADLLVAAFLAKMSRLPWRGSLSGYLRTALVWGLTGAAIALGSIPLLIDSTGDYQVTLNSVRDSVAPNGL